MSANLISVPFQGDVLSYIVQDGEQMVPIKPICDALGLAWQVQHRKLSSNSERWGVTIMVMQMPGDDQNRSVTCLPQRRLFGWLMTIHPNRVKPEARDKLIAYQQHCDEVLYRHFILGDAAHPGLMKELALLRRFNRNLTMQLLVTRQRWSRVHRLHHEGGYGWSSIQHQLGLTSSEIDDTWEAMQDCGLLPDWPGNPDKQLRFALAEMKAGEDAHG
ncbi:MAG: phage antirepressor N-terminal domain-containing protein [Magnetospirillum sp. WYHS-4]